MKEDLERFKKFIESRGHETGAWRGEVANVCLAVIASAAKQSIAAAKDGLLRVARNDDLKTGALNSQPYNTLVLLNANDDTRRGVLARDQAADDRRLGASTGSQVVLKRSTPSDSSAVKRPSTSM